MDLVFQHVQCQLLVLSGSGESALCSASTAGGFPASVPSHSSHSSSPQEIIFLSQKRHRSNDSTASGRDRSHSCDSAEGLPCKLKEEPWLQEMCNAFLQQYIQYLQSMGFILVQVRPPSPTTRRSVMFWESCWWRRADPELCPGLAQLEGSVPLLKALSCHFQ